MKFLVVLALIVASALAAPPRQSVLKQAARPVRQDDSGSAQILKYENDNIGLDSYNFAYETSDGVSRSESAVVNGFGGDAEELAVSGSYSYIGDDGVTYTVTYIADKNGFQPSGAHLPVA